MLELPGPGGHRQLVDPMHAEYNCAVQIVALLMGKGFDYAAACKLYRASTRGTPHRFPEWCAEFRAAVDAERERLRALGRPCTPADVKLTRAKIPCPPYQLPPEAIKEVQKEMQRLRLCPNMGRNIRGCVKTKGSTLSKYGTKIANWIDFVISGLMSVLFGRRVDKLMFIALTQWNNARRTLWQKHYRVEDALAAERAIMVAISILEAVLPVSTWNYVFHQMLHLARQHRVMPWAAENCFSSERAVGQLCKLITNRQHCEASIVEALTLAHASHRIELAAQHFGTFDGSVLASALREAEAKDKKMQFNIAHELAHVPNFMSRTSKKLVTVTFGPELQAACLYLFRGTDDHLYDWLTKATKTLFPRVPDDEQKATKHLLVALHRIHEQLAMLGSYEDLEAAARKYEQDEEVLIARPLAIWATVQLTDDKDSTTTVSVMQALYAYFFCRSDIFQGFHTCKFANITYVTRERQLELRSGSDYERTLFVCTIGVDRYVGQFENFIHFSFPQWLDMRRRKACVQCRKLAEVVWFPKVKDITVTAPRTTSAVGSISYVPLDEASLRGIQKDPETVIDLACKDLNVQTATLVMADEVQATRLRYLFPNNHTPPCAADPDYDDAPPPRRRPRLAAYSTNAPRRRRRRRTIVHKRGYLVCKPHS